MGKGLRVEETFIKLQRKVDLLVSRRMEKKDGESRDLGLVERCK